MAQVYIHLPKRKAEHAAACGIKLSEYKVREFSYKGKSYNCFIAWLHPNDDEIYQGNPDYSCVGINIENRYCFVGELDTHPSELYFTTLKPFAEYRLGEFRRPQCLICCTVLPVQASLQGRRLDVPLLYDNSQQLFLDNMQSFFDANFQSYQNDKFYAFFDMLAQEKQFEKIEKDDIVTFVGKFATGEDRCFSFKKPDMSAYSFESTTV